mmetsp:Transcript_56618/g.165577  ORF Transcript_56618/g.165577 Transcript_56618/m.165577 type:complete len:461 (+) Transcript_56618:72-1454(+)
MAASIVSARLVDGNNVEIVPASPGRPFCAPGVFLRDSCQCGACFHPTTLQRLVDNVDPDVVPAAVDVAPGGESLSVTWADGHVTTLEAGWFAAHVRGAFFPLRAAKAAAATAPVPWAASWMAGHLDSELTFDFEEVCARSHATAEWVAALRRYGLTRLRGAPCRTGQVERLATAIHCPLRATVYNEGGAPTFQVKAKPMAVNQAYTSAELPLHTDLPFYRRPPEVQLLHCIVQDGDGGEDGSEDASSSGASVFADGLFASLNLAASDRAMLEALPVVFEDLDPPPPTTPVATAEDARNANGSAAAAAALAPRFHLEAAHPVLEPRPHGAVAVHLNNGVRAAIACLDPELPIAPAGATPAEAAAAEADALRCHYSAVASLRRALDKEAYSCRARPGDVWVFDNRRVLHGRRAVTAGADGAGASAASEGAPPPLQRHLEGAYMEWDDLDSLQRVLQAQPVPN